MYLYACTCLPDNRYLLSLYNVSIMPHYDCTGMGGGRQGIAGAIDFLTSPRGGAFYSHKSVCYQKIAKIY